MTLRNLVFGLVGLTALILATTQFMNNRIWLAGAVVAMAILWGVGFWRGVQWPAGLGLLIFSITAAMGVFDGSPLWLMILSLLLTLVAWDVSFLFETIAEAEVLDGAVLYRVHFNRLGSLMMGGLVLSGIMFLFEFAIRPIWAILLGLFVIYGLSRTIRFLRQASD